MLVFLVLSENDFIVDSDSLPAGQTHSTRKFLKRLEELRAQNLQEEAEDAERIASQYRERTRKCQRTGPSPYDIKEDALDKQLMTGTDFFPEGLEIDDSQYEMFMIRVSVSQ